MTSRFARGLLIAAMGTGMSFAPGPVHGECLVNLEPNPIVRLRNSRYVYLAQVMATAEQGRASVKVIRSWKGNRRTFQWEGYYGAIPGQYYLVFGGSDPERFDHECGIVPTPLEKAHREITLLNRHRGFPRLVVPTN